MIKKIKQKDFFTNNYIEMMFCDNCGEGMSLGDKKEEQRFEKIHKNCRKIKNKNI